MIGGLTLNSLILNKFVFIYCYFIVINSIFLFNRLKKKRIYSIFPDKINISGKINVMCFDKTGTLTEEGLEMYGVRPNCYDSSKFHIF